MPPPPPGDVPGNDKRPLTESVGTKQPLKRSIDRIGTDEELEYQEPQWLPDHDDPKRPQFNNKSKYYFTLIGFALGNGNFWRIPSGVRFYGGGHFLIQYILCMFVFGLPTLYMEMVIGQMAQAGVAQAFGMYVPILQGVGWAICALSFVRAASYNLLNAYSLHYAADSLISINKYTSCEHKWNSNHCISYQNSAKKCGDVTNNSTERHYWFQGACKPSSFFRSMNLSESNQLRFASKEYFQYAARGRDAGEIEFRIGAWAPIVCLFFCWLYPCISLVRRTKFLGKRAMHIVATSLIIFTLFLLQVVTMPHAGEGIRLYFTFDFKKWDKLESWAAAINESCQSLCLGMGGMVTMASYNKRSNDAFWDAVVIVVVMTVASTMAGLQAYAVWGLIMHKYEFADWNSKLLKPQGQALYFVSFPEIVHEMKMYKLWQFLFYAMLLCIGMSTLTCLIEVPICALTDKFRWCKKNRALMICGLCLVGFLLGLPNFTKMGYNIFYQSEILAFSIVGDYLVGLEVVVMLVYGPRKFYRDIYGSMARHVNCFGQWLSPYGLLIRLAQVFLSPALAFYAAEVLVGWRPKLTDKNVTVIPTLIYSITFLLWPFVLAGAIKAVVDNVRAKRPWLALLRATEEHPAIRYSLPAPVGNFFLPRPIEVSPMPIPQVETAVSTSPIPTPTTEAV